MARRRNDHNVYMFDDHFFKMRLGMNYVLYP
jgi:hypothetical protein